MYKKKEKKIENNINDKSIISDSLKINFQHKTSSSRASSIEKFNYDSIKKFYDVLACSNKSNDDIIKIDCFIIRLSRFIIDLITSHKFSFLNSSLDDNFYEICMNKIIATDLADEVNEDELLLIYIKQLIYLLKTSGILCNNSGVAEIKIDNNSDVLLYSELFNTFWNDAKWEDIFPSDPIAAKELKNNKNFVKDTILNNSGKVRIDVVINNFFELTGFARKNDLFYISFIDFYLFSWLKHFGVINYLKNSRNQPVFIELTDNGKKFLQMVG